MSLDAFQGNNISNSENYWNKPNGVIFYPKSYPQMGSKSVQACSTVNQIKWSFKSKEEKTYKVTTSKVWKIDNELNLKKERYFKEQDEWSYLYLEL